MKSLKWAGIIGGTALAVSTVPQAFATTLPLVIDTFTGGPDTVNIVSLLPGGYNANSFPEPPIVAIGGWRDVFVQSITPGIYASGVAFGQGGYASFGGTGDGAIIWDGKAGLAGGPPATLPDNFTFGYKLFEDCPTPLIHVSARADIGGSNLEVILYNDATDYGTYTIALPGGGGFADYYAPVLGPYVATGAYDPMGAINAFELYFNGAAIPDVDIQASLLEIVCVPESGTWMAMAGLGGLMGLTWRRMRANRSK